jgi:hypothetical protein
LRSFRLPLEPLDRPAPPLFADGALRLKGKFPARRSGDRAGAARIYIVMIRKLKSGQFRLYSRKKNAQTGKRRNLGTFATLDQAKQHEREVQYFKRH